MNDSCISRYLVRIEQFVSRARTISRILLLTPLSMLAAALPAEARGGGGHSFHSGGFGGGHSFGGGSFSGGFHSYGGGGGSFSAFDILVIIAIIVIVALVKNYNNRQGGGLISGLPLEYDNNQPPTGPLNDTAAVQAAFDRLRAYDPNFSEIAFTDFAYALYARAHEARGRGSLDTLSPYLSPAATGRLQPVPPLIRDVTGVIVGGHTISSVTNPDAAPEVTISVRYEANYTEQDAGNNMEGYYAVEQWEFTRRRDVLSKAPEAITALHCPNCGGALEKRSDGACAHCGVTVTGGDFAWYVTQIAVLERDQEGPLLTSDVPEEGTDLPTVFQPDLAQAEQRFQQSNPEFAWPRVEERFRYIFNAIQDAWSSLNWERARPFETDNIFQMHRYWIEAYKKQGLRNVLENVEIESVTPVRFQEDAFYDAMTTRIFASMRDSTVDAQGKVVCGSPTRPRRFSEYWTFIRRRGASENKHDIQSCPNCGAPLKINMAGNCEFCGGKVASGEFDWVLSRIEQDETYAG
ncbi:MAG TPA: TIM44-like domain-containing protein [Armatimonadota bacterium]|nr:TIM44-like domain-containing protein [Armatimonadota bacterium]